MKYILQNKAYFNVSSLQEYLYYAMQSFFIITSVDKSTIVLESFPIIEDNVVFFYGHNYWVSSYLDEHAEEYRTSIKVINSCKIKSLRKVLYKQSDVYISKVDEYGYTQCYKGRKFGLNWDVTLSELDFLNNPQLPLLERICLAYRKVA